MLRNFMEIRFSDTRPSGDFALVLPAAGSARPGLDSIGGAKSAVEGALKRNRFEGESGAVVEHFVDGDKGGRLLVIGTGDDATKGDGPEKLGGSAVARLLTSGETSAVIDLSGLDYDADAAARAALGAA